MSGKTNESNRELISAYLDNALSASERLQAEQLLASDASAARYLEQLRATQASLRSLAPSSMRSSIAELVISRARAQAIAEGLTNEHHVLRGSRPTDASTPVLIPSSLSQASSANDANQPITGADRAWTDWIPRSNRLLWSSLVTTAAAIIAIVAMPNLFDPMPQADPLISQVLPDSLVSPERLPLPTIDGIEPRADGEVSPFDSIATADETMRPDSTGGGGLPVRREDKELGRMQLEYFMTVDAAMSREAWESSYFDTLLAKAGVPKGNPIPVDAELINLLDDSLVIVSAADSAGSSGKRKAALLFVRANGQSVDNLLMAMSQDRAHFLSVSYNLSVNDENRMLLSRLLRKQITTQADGELGARVLRGSQETSVDGELVPNFVAHDPVRAVDGLGFDDPRLGGRSGLNSSPATVAEVLVILREPPAE